MMMNRYGRGGYKLKKGRPMGVSISSPVSAVPAIERSAVRVAGDNVRELQDAIREDSTKTPVVQREEKIEQVVTQDYANLMTPSPKPNAMEELVAPPVPEPTPEPEPEPEPVRPARKLVEIEESGGF